MGEALPRSGPNGGPAALSSANTAADETALTSYRVWDAGTRWFHWINALCVIALSAVGYVILHAKGLDISNDGKITLKTIHTWIGYGFALTATYMRCVATSRRSSPGIRSTIWDTTRWRASASRYCSC